MNARPVGGRGKQAPYDTKLMRVPIPLQGQVKQLIERYYVWLDTLDSNGSDANNPPNLLDTAKPVNSLVEIESKPVNKLLEDRSKAVNNLIENEPKPVDELTETEVEDSAKPVNELLEISNQDSTLLSDELDLSPKPMGLRKLAERLGVPRSTLSDWNKKLDFELKTRAKDPDAIAWRYDIESKLFYPISE